jgi:hypothetical protein
LAEEAAIKSKKEKSKVASVLIKNQAVKIYGGVEVYTHHS